MSKHPHALLIPGPTPEELDWFDRDRLNRQGLGMGTFSNMPDPMLDLATIAAAAREAEALAAAYKPERFDFGDVSVAGFWSRIQRIEFVGLRTEYDVGAVIITSIVPDRDTGKPIEITFKNIISVKAWESPARAEIVRQTLRDWLHHEIDEHIFAGGRRAFEPHAPKQPWDLDGLESPYQMNFGRYRSEP